MNNFVGKTNSAPVSSSAGSLQTPMGSGEATSAALASIAPLNHIKRVRSKAFVELQRVPKLQAIVQTHFQSVIKSLSELPPNFLVLTLEYCDGPRLGKTAGMTLDDTLTLSKRFTTLTNQARRQRVLTLAQQPNRIVQEKLPTRLELMDMGIPNPDMTNILRTMEPELPKLLADEEGPLTRNIRTHARLQQAIKEFGGVEKRYSDGFDEIGQVNGAGETHGFGIRTYHNQSGKKYIGNIENGAMNGFGYIERPDGYRLEGTHVSGLLNGPSKEFRANGDRFELIYVNGHAEGPGKMFCANGDRFEGTYVNGQATGLGRYFYSNGNHFEGLYENGQRHGQGTYFFANGDHFEGLYENGRRHGRCTHFLTNGDRYEGISKNDRWHGKRTHFYANGNMPEEESENDSFSGSDYVSGNDKP